MAHRCQQLHIGSALPAISSRLRSRRSQTRSQPLPGESHCCQAGWVQQHRSGSAVLLCHAPVHVASKPYATYKQLAYAATRWESIASTARTWTPGTAALLPTPALPSPPEPQRLQFPEDPQPAAGKNPVCPCWCARWITTELRSDPAEQPSGNLLHALRMLMSQTSPRL